MFFYFFALCRQFINAVVRKYILYYDFVKLLSLYIIYSAKLKNYLVFSYCYFDAILRYSICVFFYFFYLLLSIYCCCSNKIYFILCFYHIAIIVYNLIYQVKRLFGFLLLLLCCNIAVFCLYKYQLTFFCLRLKANFKRNKSLNTLKSYYS